jgi:hypothetical protein
MKIMKFVTPKNFYRVSFILPVLHFGYQIIDPSPMMIALFAVFVAIVFGIAAYAHVAIEERELKGNSELFSELDAALERRSVKPTDKTS